MKQKSLTYLRYDATLFLNFSIYGKSRITMGKDKFKSSVFLYIEDQIGGNGEVHHGDPSGSIVL